MLAGWVLSRCPPRGWHPHGRNRGGAWSRGVPVLGRRPLLGNEEIGVERDVHPHLGVLLVKYHTAAHENANLFRDPTARMRDVLPESDILRPSALRVRLDQSHKEQS